LPYTVRLPNVSHTFLPGHRILVQIQSSWFPLYDRNPQKYIPNIMFAKPEDFTKATQRIWHAPGNASSIEFPVVETVCVPAPQLPPPAKPGVQVICE
jgi:predicted acyl esterase